MAHLTATLLSHQEEALEWCLMREKGGCILADDMGLGKTVTTCAVMCARVVPTLIIAPLALLDQWKSEIEKHANGLMPMIYQGAKRIFPAMVIDTTVVITNPETVLSDFKKGRVNAYTQFERIVLDEAHVFRNPKSKIFLAMKEIFSEHECNKILLTGTPVCNKSEDLITMITLLNLDPYSNTCFWDCLSIEDKITHLQEIRKNYMLRRTKEDILGSKLPKKEIITVPINLEESEMYLQEYTQLKQQHIKPVILKIMRLRQCVNDISLISDEYDEISAKLQYIKKTIASLPAGDKIVIFSQWTTMLHHIQKYIASEETLMYHGKMTTEEKNNALTRFKTDPSARVMLMSLRSGSCGLNLCVANHVVIVEPYFNAAEEKQAIDRVYRIGQTKDVYVHKLYVPNTVESWIHGIQSYKDCVCDSILDDQPVSTIAEKKNSKKESFDKFVLPTETQNLISAPLEEQNEQCT